MIVSQRTSMMLLFSALALVFGVTVTWMLGNNYGSDTATYNWVAMRAIFDADTIRLENLGFDRPYGPVLVLAPFYLLPWIQPYSPYIVSVAVSAFLFTLWYRHLMQAGLTRLKRNALFAIMVINPVTLWSATSGGGEATALLLFYLLYRSCLRMIYEKDIRSFVVLGLVLALFFWFNIISLYLFAALLPLLVMLVPIPQLRDSPVATYIIIGMPLLIVLAAWGYVNWIFRGNPLAFLDSYNSAFLGAKAQAETMPWLREHGGSFFAPAATGLVMTMIAYPVLIYILWLRHREGRQLKVSLALIFHPVISIGLATFTFFLASPLQLTSLVMASVMAEIGRMNDLKNVNYIVLALLLVIGTMSGWYQFMRGNDPYVRPWLSSLAGAQEIYHVGDIKLGRWLEVNREPTMMDLKSGVRVIAARGDAENLLLPFTHEFRLTMRTDLPSVTQIAVPQPESARGRKDAINMRFPMLYESGMAGFERVYDDDGWRVYRRKS